MAHYAILDKNNIVTQVFVGKDKGVQFICAATHTADVIAKYQAFLAISE
jgi:hypothetical protein